LTHHGILGQKWGVRRYQNKDGSLTPAGRARLLNSYDDQLKAVEIEITNAAGRARHYQRKADKAKARGKQLKADQFQMIADDNKKLISAYAGQYDLIGRKYTDEIMSLQESNLPYKVLHQEFATPSGKAYKAATQDVIKRYGKVHWTQRMYDVANASSGNRFKVGDPNKMSDAKKRRWEGQHSLNDHRAQRIEYTYV